MHNTASIRDEETGPPGFVNMERSQNWWEILSHSITDWSCRFRDQIWMNEDGWDEWMNKMKWNDWRWEKRKVMKDRRGRAH